MVDARNIGVIFDCDGTLLDSMGVWRELEADLARRAGAELSQADKDALTTMTIPECGAFLHEKFGLGTSGAHVEGMIHEFMMDFYTNRAAALPGALEFVQALDARGVAMTVASSTPRVLLEAGLAATGFASYLQGIVSVDDVGKSKREPAVYHRAREIMGTPLASTWGVEDSLYAVHTLACAGYNVLALCDRSDPELFEQMERAAHITIPGFAGYNPEDFLQAAQLLAR